MFLWPIRFVFETSLWISFNRAFSVKVTSAKVLLIIEDNGPGFPKNRESLTNPYVTLRDKGTGLGLSIVSRIIEEHNGKLILEDSKLGGAKIIIEFPIWDL